MIDKEQVSQLHQATLPNENLQYVYGPTVSVFSASDPQLPPLRAAGITVPDHSRTSVVSASFAVSK